MSKKLEEALIDIIKNQMPECKGIVIKAYENRYKKLLVPIELVDKDAYRLLVKAEIFSVSKSKTVNKKEYEVLKLTDRGKEIASEMYAEPSIELLKQSS